LQTSLQQNFQNSFSGQFGRLERLNPTRHGAGLWAALKDHAALWDYMAYGPFEDEASFMLFLMQIATQQDPYFYCILTPDNTPIGWLSLMEMRPAHRVLEVGHIVFSPTMQRTPLASEAVFLLMHYAFETLKARRFEWKCNNDNQKSQAAALRFGFSYEGLFRQHMLIKEKNRDTAWFSLIDSEWPTQKEKFERWLSKDNFDNNGQQKQSLRDI
jgi:RimJ/RimL family protein N-acetyltransferase